jgi:hypothetical protein
MNNTYNGWANYETWNVSLWMSNDEGLYELAKDTVRDGGTYGEFCNIMRDVYEMTETPDGVSWTDVNVNGLEVNEMMEELAAD